MLTRLCVVLYVVMIQLTSDLNCLLGIRYVLLIKSLFDSLVSCHVWF